MLVDGIGKNAAVLIKMFPEVCRRYLLDLNETGKIINSSQEVAKHVIPMFLCKTNEVVVIICLDGKGKIVFCNQVFEGSINAAAVSVRRIIEIAVRYATTDIIIAHNHPGGIAIPSEQDIIITEKIANALKIVGVRLLDHLIVAGSDWVSLASTPTLNEIFAQSSMFDIN
jgi:DNA repair protein RadC